jgi:hypothetical protein
MPIRWVGNQLRLVCANAFPPAEGAFVVQGIPQAEPVFPPGQAHMMVLLDGYALLPMVHAPNVQGHAFPLPQGDVPVRVYACMTCGYVESYLARIVAPQEWPPNV